MNILVLALPLCGSVTCMVYSSFMQLPQLQVNQFKGGLRLSLLFFVEACLTIEYLTCEKVITEESGGKYRFVVKDGSQVLRASNYFYNTETEAYDAGYLWLRQQAELIRKATHGC